MDLRSRECAAVIKAWGFFGQFFFFLAFKSSKCTTKTMRNAVVQKSWKKSCLDQLRPNSGSEQEASWDNKAAAAFSIHSPLYSELRMCGHIEPLTQQLKRKDEVTALSFGNPRHERKGGTGWSHVTKPRMSHVLQISLTY